MINKLLALFLVFIIYSFIGWCIEVVSVFKIEKKVINRGFLIGPYCPIYGIGALLMTFLLNDYSENIFILFGMSMFICTILEYLTSYIMEKLFNARWWDYSKKKFNLNGRVCLENSCAFGVAGVILIDIINKIVYYPIINNINIVTIIISSILLIIFITDIIISYITINSFKKFVKECTYDNTFEISERKKDEIEKYFKDIKMKIEYEKLKLKRMRIDKTKEIKLEFDKKHSYFKKRLIKAFPSSIISPKDNKKDK